MALTWAEVGLIFFPPGFPSCIKCCKTNFSNRSFDLSGISGFGRGLSSWPPIHVRSFLPSRFGLGFRLFGLTRREGPFGMKRAGIGSGEQQFPQDLKDQIPNPSFFGRFLLDWDYKPKGTGRQRWFSGFVPVKKASVSGCRISKYLNQGILPEALTLFPGHDLVAFSRLVHLFTVYA